MKYMGSKRRIAKHIVPIMEKMAEEKGYGVWIEPFVGGANLIDKVSNKFKRIGFDANDHVIFALKDIRDNPEKLPQHVSSEEYYAEKGKEPGSITSWIRFVCAFGGVFGSGYAKEYLDHNQHNSGLAGYRNAQKQSPLLQGVELFKSDYKDLSFYGCVIYCDPPYKDTTGYKHSEFNHEEFYQWCREQSKNNLVFVSEYQMPEDFKEIWTGEIREMQNGIKKKIGNVTEKLFVLGA